MILWNLNVERKNKIHCFIKLLFPQRWVSLYITYEEQAGGLSFWRHKPVLNVSRFVSTPLLPYFWILLSRGYQSATQLVLHWYSCDICISPRVSHSALWCRKEQSPVGSQLLAVQVGLSDFPKNKQLCGRIGIITTEVFQMRYVHTGNGDPCL